MTSLEQATAEFRGAEGGLAIARKHLHVAILAALASGTTQADIVRITGYTREHIRQIARAAD